MVPCVKDNKHLGLQKNVYLDFEDFIIYHFISPELKAQVSSSDHLWYVVCLIFCHSVNFSHFHLLLKNHWANFSQT